MSPSPPATERPESERSESIIDTIRRLASDQLTYNEAKISRIVTGSHFRAGSATQEQFEKAVLRERSLAEKLSRNVNALQDSLGSLGHGVNPVLEGVSRSARKCIDP
jgi:hypothetical protein